ncbi:molybdopterin biosynthesis protein MoeB [Diaminobutyricibacter tongyongensis]|uniref:Molybdopterin biosynthesis protein MoeB n=1 Tax=Leifsonia tongyongensis TaxID=1268043 RepID=A0A6L9Y1B0_9MICO|nr:ThiF family adenylyltransferase [Diaminobutyricibacter tongyongensis]NEN07482.1 molybdopterin biosynthesis protein MoeB [Diaminobutyricibacter tongyongensis]
MTENPPPLVEPGPALTPARLERYSRTLALPGFGEEAQRRIRAARVLVVGAGGLGSAVIPALAAAGFGTIGVVDADAVETSNLPRQTLHTPADVGRSKVASARDTITGLDSETRVVPVGSMLDSGNALALFAEFDLVLDGSDNFPTRYLVDDAATLTGIPAVWGAVHQFGGQVGVSWAQYGPTYRDLFPVPPEPGSVASCADAGALPSVCTVIGGLMVTQAITLVTGRGDPLLGRAIVHDALRSTFREVRYTRDPFAEPITRLIDYDLFCGAGAATAPDESSTLARRTGGSVTNRELQELLAQGQKITLIDVREPWEAQLASIPGSALVPLGELEADLDEDAEGVATALRDASVVIYCHYGPRAEMARRLLIEAGVADTVVLTGGIDAWAREIDPGMARY